VTRAARADVRSVPLDMDDEEFARFQALIRDKAGIALAPHKRALVVARLYRRLGVLGLATYRGYLARVWADPDELVTMLDCVCTNETSFFREPQQFSFLEQAVFPGWRRGRPRRLRAWSAACSTGEEAYSLAMVLHDQFPADEGWRFDVVATDLSTRAVAVARAATWHLRAAADIPDDYLRRYMLRGGAGADGRVQARAELRAAVHCARLNLVDERYAVGGFFDLIFCRNVLMYFDAATRVQVLTRLLARLAPDGYLHLGHAESVRCLPAIRDRVRCVAPAVYVHAGFHADGRSR